MPTDGDGDVDVVFGDDDDGGDDDAEADDAEADDGAAGTTSLRVARSKTPLNDYEGCAAALYGAFWSHFPLYRGLGAT